MNDAKALDAELTGLVYDSEVTIVDEDGVERRIGYGGVACKWNYRHV